MSDTVAAAAPLLAQQGLVELLELVKDADSVELKLSVDASRQRSACVLAACRQGDDTVVKLRPVRPTDLPKRLRRQTDFGVELGPIFVLRMKGTPPADGRNSSSGSGCTPTATGSWRSRRSARRPRRSRSLTGHAPGRLSFFSDQLKEASDAV